MTAGPVVLVQARPGEAREEWLKQPPPEWTTRLREFSPIVDKTSHLRFRWREDFEQWWLYQCTPVTALDADRIAQLSVHWSTLPTSEQMGRRQFVTEYQFWMFHTHRVDARPFWILHGSEFVTGGTPFSYTDHERRILEAMDEPGEPVPPGTLPNIPFDERVVRAIQARDRLLKFGGSLDRMLKSNRPDALLADEADTERAYREAFLTWHNTTNKPVAEFMGWYTKRKESRHTLPPAPAGLANRMADFRDRFIETGDIRGAGVPASRTLNVAVK
jgi:hypothetical protein